MCLFCAVARLEIAERIITVIVVTARAVGNLLNLLDILPAEHQVEAFQLERHAYVIGRRILITSYIDSVRTYILKYKIIGINDFSIG